MGRPDTAEPRLERVTGPGEGVVVLELAGELDLAVSARLRELVEETVAARPRLVIADLAEVAFMDSTVLRGLLHADREVGEHGGHFVVAAPQPTVRRLFELTGMVDVFTVAETREGALASQG